MREAYIQSANGARRVAHVLQNCEQRRRVWGWGGLAAIDAIADATVTVQREDNPLAGGGHRMDATVGRSGRYARRADRYARREEGPATDFPASTWT